MAGVFLAFSSFLCFFIIFSHTNGRPLRMSIFWGYTSIRIVIAAAKISLIYQILREAAHEHLPRNLWFRWQPSNPKKVRNMTNFKILISIQNQLKCTKNSTSNCRLKFTVICAIQRLNGSMLKISYLPIHPEATHGLAAIIAQDPLIRWQPSFMNWTVLAIHSFYSTGCVRFSLAFP